MYNSQTGLLALQLQLICYFHHIAMVSAAYFMMENMPNQLQQAFLLWSYLKSLQLAISLQRVG